MSKPYSYQLKHDQNGRIVEKSEIVAGKPVIWKYSYDKEGRLFEAHLDHRLICQCYYDKEGRRSRDYLPATCGYNYRDFRYKLDNRLLHAGDSTYVHDDKGFRSMWCRKGVYHLYTYAPDYRLLKMEIEGQDSVYTFRHDENGQRAAKDLNKQLVEAYQWLDFIRLGGFHDGRKSYKFGYEEDERLPSALRREDGFMFTLHYDQVGSLRVVADQSGNVIKEILYDPFGGIIEETAPGLRIPIGFAGGLHDHDLGLVRFGWRDYDPFTGRWTAPDPIGDKGGDRDWYGYCLDDPVNGIDPLGLFRFGKKGLWILPGIGTDGSTADKGNYELKHEHGFYEDSTGDNVGFFKGGITFEEDINDYQLDDTRFDDERMRKAQDSLDPGEYKLCKMGGKSNNCQDYADRLRERYRFLRTAEKHLQQLRLPGEGLLPWLKGKLMRKLMIVFLCVVAGSVYFYNTDWFQSFFMYRQYYQDIVNVPFDATRTGETITIPLKHTYRTCYALSIGVPDSKLAHRGFDGDGILAYRFISNGKVLAEGTTVRPKRRTLYQGITYINLMVFDLPFPGARNDLALELTVKEPMVFLKQFKDDLTCRIRPNYSAKAGGCYDEELRLNSR